MPAHSSGAWLETHQGGTFRRGDVRPSDDATYPATDEVRAAIAAEWDGEIGTLRDLGQRFTSVNGERYPSWRMRDIAETLGLDTRDRGAVGAAIKPTKPPRFNGGLPPKPPTAQTAPASPAPLQLPPEWNPDHDPHDPDESEPTPIEPERETPMVIPEPTPPDDDRPVASLLPLLTCARCGETFAPWKRHKGGLIIASKTCNACFRAAMRETAKRIGSQPPARKREDRDDREETPMSDPPTPVPPPPEPLGSSPATVTWDGATFRILTPEMSEMSHEASEASRASVVPVYDPRRQLRQSLHLMVDALPDGDTWTRAERSRWLEMLVGLLDFTITQASVGESEALDWRAAQ